MDEQDAVKRALRLLRVDASDDDLEAATGLPLSAIVALRAERACVSWRHRAEQSEPGEHPRP